MSRPLRSLAIALLAFAGVASARADGDAAPPAEAPVEPDTELTADEIYARVLENRFDSSAQELALVSSGRGGRSADVRVQVLWRRGGEGERKEVLSRTLVRYREPREIRRTGYLVVNRRDAPNDQFAYLHGFRRIRRMNLRSETLAGTDFAPEDIVPREMDDATYARAPDGVVDGVACFVVEATPVAVQGSAYSRFVLYVEREHFVPLRVRYFDEAGVEIKELHSLESSIRYVRGIHLPIRSTMRNLAEGTQTELRVLSLVPDPGIPDRYFSERQLLRRRIDLPDDVLEGLVVFP